MDVPAAFTFSAHEAVFVPGEDKNDQIEQGDCHQNESDIKAHPVALIKDEPDQGHDEEVPDEEYPLVLTTGRMLEHWHTGAMTRRAGVLNAIEPYGIAAMNPYEIQRQGLAVGATVTIETRRGVVEAILRADREVADGMVFMPFCFNESPANKLTNPMLDPYGKIPEFKYCAARVAPLAERIEAAE